MRYEINDAMAKHGLVWTEAWDTPVHEQCSKTTVCKCVVPLGTKVCPVHKRAVDPRPAMAPIIIKKPEPLVVPVYQPIPASLSSTPRAPAAEMERAAWLPPPSTKTRAKDTLDLEPEASKAPTSKPQLKRPAPPSKPVANSKRALLEASAESCKYKINTWSNAASLGRDTQPQGGGGGWSLAQHNRTFDPEFHGYREVNGVYGYRRAPDGKFIPTQSTVNTLNPDGTLTPLVDLDHQPAPDATPAEKTKRAHVTMQPPAVVARQVSKAKRAWMEAAGKTSQFKIEAAFTAEKK
jgi:hypothetical protein